jgi:hypothetical protein
LVFTRGAFDVRGAEIIRDERFPSDHYFISAEISARKFLAG